MMWHYSETSDTDSKANGYLLRGSSHQDQEHLMFYL